MLSVFYNMLKTGHIHVHISRKCVKFFSHRAQAITSVQKLRQIEDGLF